jgi:hypothetical protein
MADKLTYEIIGDLVRFSDGFEYRRAPRSVPGDAGKAAGLDSNQPYIDPFDMRRILRGEGTGKPPSPEDMAEIQRTTRPPGPINLGTIDHRAR